MSRDRSVFLRHIQLCLDRIDTYTTEGEEAFFADPKTQDAVVRNLEIIGQAAKDLGVEDLALSAPEIPWKQIAGLRNVLAHPYLGVDLLRVERHRTSPSRSAPGYRGHTPLRFRFPHH